MIFNMVTGCGSNVGINLSIVAYPSEDAVPETSKENTIAVITDTPITSWAMSAEEPEEPIEGMVWVLTGTTSSVSFNILKKNCIKVYPLKTYQYVSGTWVEKESMSCQNGTWVDWFNGLFFDNGDQCISVTGGWTNEGWEYNYDSNAVISSTISSTHMTVTGDYIGASQYSKTSIVGTVNKINIDNISKIYADIEITSAGTVYLGVTPTKNAAESGNAANTANASVGKHTLEIDVSSLTGEYYIVLFASGTSGSGYNPSANITKVWA